MIDRIRKGLAFVIIASLFGCSTLRHKTIPTVATVTTDHLLRGEARFVGELRFHNGCLVAVAGAKVATPILDRDVILQPDGSAIDDVRHGLQIPVGKRFAAGAAWLRDDGSGWSIADIESSFGIHIPNGCPVETIVRLHDFSL